MTNNNNWNRRDPFEQLRDRNRALHGDVDRQTIRMMEPLPLSTYQQSFAEILADTRRQMQTASGIQIPPASDRGPMYSAGTVNQWTTATTSSYAVNNSTIAYQGGWDTPERNLIFGNSGAISIDDAFLTEYLNKPIPNPVVEAKRIKIEKIKRQYTDWRSENIAMREDNINTSIFRFRRQSSYSLEHRLLRAIFNNISIKTKTTKYDPRQGIVSVYNQSIAWINIENKQIEKIRLPGFTDNHVNDLVRLRFRQLGLTCHSHKTKTRISHNKFDKAYLIPGLEYIIPELFRTCCLPTSFRTKLDPLRNPVSNQFRLDFHEVIKDPGVTLHNKSYQILSYHIQEEVIQFGNSIMIRLKGVPMNRYSSNRPVGYEYSVSSRDSDLILHYAIDRCKNELHVLIANETKSSLLGS